MSQPYRNLINSNITLQTVNLTQQGFGSILFAATHKAFPERVRSYTTLDAVAEDFSTDSNVYAALRSAFLPTPQPSIVKVGRRDADLSISVEAGSTEASLSVVASSGGVSYTLPISLTGLSDESAVATAIAASIEGDSDVGPLLVATASSSSVEIDVASPTVEFYINNLSDELSEVYTNEESAADLITNLSDEDDDYFFFTCEDHTGAFQEAASVECEARLKMYFSSTQDTSILAAYDAGNATDIAGILADSNRDRSKLFFHQDADAIFPELSHVAVNAPYPAGSVVWANIDMPISISQNPDTGRALTTSEKNFLELRNVSYTERSVATGVVVNSSNLRNNLTASGEWISNIRGRDNLEVDINAAVLRWLLSQKGTKLTYSDETIAALVGVIESVMNVYVLRGFIKEGFLISTTSVADSPLSERQTGLYSGLTFRAELEQGILFVDLSGALSLTL